MKILNGTALTYLVDWTGECPTQPTDDLGEPILPTAPYAEAIFPDKVASCLARGNPLLSADRGSQTPRLAIVEMPPFADANDPPPWFPLRDSVASGRLDASHDWFATTPVAVVLRDGVVTKAAEGDAAGDPAEFFPRIP